jgi:hypothetical protein
VPQLDGFEKIAHDIDKTRRRQNDFIDDPSVTQPTRLSLRTLRDSTSCAFAYASFAPAHNTDGEQKLALFRRGVLRVVVMIPTYTT